MGPGAVTGSTLESVAALDAFLVEAPADSEWILKAEFGHAGLANRRLRRPRLTDADRRFVEERFGEDDRLVAERWCDRRQDHQG